MHTEVADEIMYIIKVDESPKTLHSNYNSLELSWLNQQIPVPISLKIVSSSSKTISAITIVSIWNFLI